MTSIILKVTGAKARAAASGPLTSGMVGIPVTIEYDDAWDGLTKNLVCSCGEFGPENSKTRTVLNIDETATVAHEVMQAGKYLYLGVEGYSADGKLVMPTTWAKCGIILPGANAGADPSANPKLPVWAQLQTEINQIKLNTVTQEQIAAAVAAYLEENPIEVPDCSGNPDQSGGLSTTAVNLLMDVLNAAQYHTNVSGKIASLKEALLAGSSDDSGSGDSGDSGGSGEDSGGEETVADEITVADGVMTIVAVGSAITVSDGVMTIA